jgi:hypothetical protein
MKEKVYIYKFFLICQRGDALERGRAAEAGEDFEGAG